LRQARFPWLKTLEQVEFDFQNSLDRRPVLLLSVAGTITGFLLLVFAPALGEFFAPILGFESANPLIIAIFFLSRILAGLTGGNITVAQAYIADVTNEQNRTKGLGLVGAAFGFGLIIGPASRVGRQCP
jgi:DHA1 family tetracycline resistance protein-like MFS transporter